MRSFEPSETNFPISGVLLVSTYLPRARVKPTHLPIHSHWREKHDSCSLTQTPSSTGSTHGQRGSLSPFPGGFCSIQHGALDTSSQTQNSSKLKSETPERRAARNNWILAFIQRPTTAEFPQTNTFEPLIHTRRVYRLVQPWVYGREDASANSHTPRLFSWRLL